MWKRSSSFCCVASLDDIANVVGAASAVISTKHHALPSLYSVVREMPLLPDRA